MDVILCQRIRDSPHTINIKEVFVKHNIMAKIGKFSKKYGLFLSEASNEEIVSVSKELMDGMSAEIKSVNPTALALLGTSVLSLILMITLVSGMETTLTGTLKSVVFLTRILAIAFLCMSAIVAGLVIGRASDASSISTLLWRNVRETANDERAYEQIQAIRVAGVLMNSSKTLVKVAALIIAFAGLALAAGFTLELLAASSYI